MEEKNNIDEEVRLLLHNMEVHGQNAKRQARLSELIDHLSEEEHVKHKKIKFLWWPIGMAAAILLLLFVLMPLSKQKTSENVNPSLATRQTMLSDSLIPQTSERALPKEQFTLQETVAETVSSKTHPRMIKKSKPELMNMPIEIAEPRPEENPILSEQFMSINTDSTSMLPIEILAEETAQHDSSLTQSSQRKIIQSNNLVSYKNERKEAFTFFKKPYQEKQTIFGQPQDRNIQNGILAFEFKLSDH